MTADYDDLIRAISGEFRQDISPVLTSGQETGASGGLATNQIHQREAAIARIRRKAELVADQQAF